MDVILDIGNRRVKWAKSTDIQKLLSKKHTPAQQQSLCHVIDFAGGIAPSKIAREFRAVPEPGSAWISCTGQAHVSGHIQKVFLGQWGIHSNFVDSRDIQHGIKNGYLDPGQLGVDRWLAMVAARYLIPDRPLLVIDAGTAITIDYIDITGLFQGGMIVPGFMTIMESLSQKAGLPAVNPDIKGLEHFTLQNQDTRSSIVNGALHTAVASIEKAIARYRKEVGKKLVVVITGGDGPLINHFSKFRIKELPALVLIGLYIVSRDHDC